MWDSLQLFLFVHVMILWYLVAFVSVLSYFLRKWEDQFWNILCLISSCIWNRTNIICNLIFYFILGHFFSYYCICYFVLVRTGQFMWVVSSMVIGWVVSSMVIGFTTFSRLQLIILGLFNLIMNLYTVYFINHHWFKSFLFGFSLSLLLN